MIIQYAYRIYTQKLHPETKYPLKVNKETKIY